VSTYPKTIDLDTPDGDGQATKAAQGEPWEVAVPYGDFRFYGTSAQMQAEVKRYVKKTLKTDQERDELREAQLAILKGHEESRQSLDKHVGDAGWNILRTQKREANQEGKG
jgi:hypothetical protein